jgi:hypothetical protein
VLFRSDVAPRVARFLTVAFGHDDPAFGMIRQGLNRGGKRQSQSSQSDKSDMLCVHRVSVSVGADRASTLRSVVEESKRPVSGRSRFVTVCNE